jgi:transposase
MMGLGADLDRGLAGGPWLSCPSPCQPPGSSYSDFDLALMSEPRTFSTSYIYKALIRRRRIGEVSASSRRGHRPRKLTAAQEAALAAHIAAHPDLTLAALQIWLLDEHAVRLSNGTMWSAVARLGLSFKKTLHTAEQDRPDVAPNREGEQTSSRCSSPEKVDGAKPLCARHRLGRWSPGLSADDGDCRSPRCSRTGFARP